MEPREALNGFLDELSRRWLRGLVVVHGDLGEAVDILASAMLRRGSCVLVAPREVEAPRGCTPVGPGSLERLLGVEADYVIVATPGLLRPNLVAAAAGVVKGGGALAVAAPPLEEWQPGPLGGVGGWKRYLLASIREAEPLLWLQLPGEVLAYRPPSGVGRRPRRPGGVKLPGRLRGIASLAATRGQARVLEAAAALARGRARSLLVLGDRGRGKSYALGLASAMLLGGGYAAEAAVIAPEPCSLGSFWRGLAAGLEALGLRPRTVERRGCVEAVKAPWLRAAYAAPDEAEAAGLLVVDEAAAVGVARLRRLSWRSGRVMAATTIHGYEGSGRAMALLASQVLPRPLETVELEEPIRYSIGDPLEEWSFRVFSLRPDPGEPPEPGALRHSVLDAAALAENPGLVRRIHSLLALAHYRTEPDYLLTMLESRTHTIHVLADGDKVAAAADLALEEPGLEEPARLGLKLLWLASGEEPGFRAARIVRIAVHPELQRRGLGTKLLGHVEEYARSRGAAAVLAVFGRHDVLGFWLHRGYTVYYVSPRYNRYTGEKNIAVAKPLSPEALGLVEKAAAETRLRLIHGGHGVYRDLAAEKMVEMLSSMPPAVPRCTASQSPRLRLLEQGIVEHEQVIDIAYAAVAALLAERLPEPRSCAVAVVAHLVQGKPLHEAAEVAGIDEETARDCIRRTVLEAAARG